jgi:hypothetical protein
MRVSTTTAVSCAFRTYRLPTDWYLPSTAPIGLLYAQHGFVERKGAWTEFAGAAAEAGFVVFAPTLPSADLFGCTVQNLGNNSAFLRNVAGLFAASAGQGGALQRSFGAAVDQSGRSDLALPTQLVVIGHSAGGEAVLEVARQLIGGPADLRGVVLADPVPSIVGHNMVDSLRALAPHSLPIRLLAAPPSACNARQRGTRAVLTELAERDFLGALLTTGSHADILGRSVGRIERMTCGTPNQDNIDAARTLALGWLSDAVGSANQSGRYRDFYPGGEVYDTLLTDNVISTLPGPPESRKKAP